MVAAVQCLTDEKGERHGVLLPLTEYERVLDDLEDLPILSEKRAEPPIPHGDFIEELKRVIKGA